jgi:hypothetical protein
MPVESLALAPRKAEARSRISNGHDLLPGIDGRSAVARRYRDISGAIIIDQGGIDRCSESRLQLIRRFAAAAVLAEQLEGRLANGEQVDINEHATLSSTLVRLAAKIGIDRVPKDVTPSLHELLQAEADEAPDTETCMGEAFTVINGHPGDDPSVDEVGA